MSFHPSRILLLHNYYQQAGGEDQVVASETALLGDHGHDIVTYTKSNDAIKGVGGLGLLGTTLWNAAVYRELRDLIRQKSPALAHFHNTFPLISPAAYYAAHREGVPVVQTLHNYRLLCANATLFRNNQVCEKCVPIKVPVYGLIHKCYRESYLASAAVTAMSVLHRVMRTWQNEIDVFIALTDFARQKFIDGGIPADKIMVKPNFVYSDPGVGATKRDGFLCVGRLSQEKGLDVLVEAWAQLSPRIRLTIVGDGPLAPFVAEMCKKYPQIEWVGRIPQERAMGLLKTAQALVFPSRCYEGFPLAIAEAFATGSPVITANLGSMSSLVRHNETGLHFKPGDAADLAMQVAWLVDHEREAVEMGKAARLEYELKYGADENYRRLLGIYHLAQRNFKDRNS